MAETSPLVLGERIDGSVAILTLDNPARRNALSVEMRHRMIEALRRLEADPAIRALVLTGSGGHFSAGGDIVGQDTVTLADGRERFRITHEMVRLMVGGGKPIIAAVEGWAAGAGLSLALLCDTVVAGDTAKFTAPFGKIGLVADLGLLHTLPERIGQGRARQMLLYGEPVAAAEALSIGLVDRVVPAGTVLEAALERARLLGEAAPLPVAITRRYLSRGLEEALDWERDMQAALMTTEDHREGRLAFLEKRAPRFIGR
ncbi:MAG: enoyl-CoA hydratase/isomerase family protein [Alphaproteobacteria bacterium]|nr:enoyl-CoA hydratase/isomerase family protein [Alphaproteobacteria bacterium]MBU0797177.1 enoyl-CoA hydratase/isomerase family protein [Alphaproteobacteria bacterium]MBU0887152.1 enoyl-CoA hydratase/isomerase family protein [Alphaproteobacteria bacterium]MBU1814402.1 enoyl-CoA hydratase/isomerase family protein [Alphaproteobacteria bacterium]